MRNKNSDCEGQAVDWNDWVDMISVEVWEAIALSMDIEPKTLPDVDWHPIFGGPFDDCPAEFKRRLKIALNHIANGELRCTSLAFTNPPHSTVRLTNFGDWAHARGWCLPDRFPRGPTPALAPPASRKRPKDADLDQWMAANVRLGDKREASIAKCCTDTGATFRAAAAAWKKLAPEKRLRRGQHGPVIKSDT